LRINEELVIEIRSLHHEKSGQAMSHVI
jgi:hypothetical protein